MNTRSSDYPIDPVCTAKIIDGRKIARDFSRKISAHVSNLKSQHSLIPGLAVILVGDDPASKIYVANKQKSAEKVGIDIKIHRLDKTTSEEALSNLIKQLNHDQDTHGILLQMPLPPHLDAPKLIEKIDYHKDVDGLHPTNAGKLMLGMEDGLVPCTPQGCLHLIKQACPSLSGKNAVIIGRSILVGKPLAQLLLKENCTVTTAHSRTKDLPAITAGADILVAAAGHAKLVRSEWIKSGAIVIDVGTNRVEDAPYDPNHPYPSDTIMGDVCFTEASQKAGALTPVPGGVGPMTITYLLINTIKAACRQNGLDVIDLCFE